MNKETIKQTLMELGVKIFNLSEEFQKVIFIYRSDFYIAEFKTVYGCENIYELKKQSKIPETIGDLYNNK